MRTRFVLPCLLVILCGATLRTAAQTPHDGATYSTERLARVDALLQQYVDDDRLAGAVALVLQEGRPIYERAFGWSDREAGRRMTPDTLGTLRSPEGLGFGFGFETTDRFGANGLDGPGAFGWGGAYGTLYRVDPASGTVLVLMLQLLPNATDVRQTFPTLVYQALVCDDC